MMNRKELWEYSEKKVASPTVVSIRADILSAGIQIAKARSRLKLLTNLAEANEDDGSFYDVEDMIGPASDYEKAVAKRNALFFVLVYTIRNLGHNIEVDFL
jgi:hypothetical protein